MNTPYERWLIEKRFFCENIHCVKQAVHVIVDYKGIDTCVCLEHSGRQEIGSVGKADWKYQPQNKRTTTPVKEKEQTYANNRRRISEQVSESF